MKNKLKPDDDRLDKEFDFKNARPNPYWLGVVDRKRVRLIDDDLAPIFPDDESVNSALRSVAEAKRPRRPKASARRVVGPKRSQKVSRK